MAALGKGSCLSWPHYRLAAGRCPRVTLLGGLVGHARCAEGAVRYPGLRRILPRPLLRHILHFEAAIEDAVQAYAASLPVGSRVLDAGAGEGPYAAYFQQ